MRKRSHRDEAGLFLLESLDDVKRAARHGHPATALFYCPTLLSEEGQAWVGEQDRAGIETFVCTQEVFAKISYRERPEGILALVRQFHLSVTDLALPENPLLIVAEAVEKPGNLGSMLRAADGAGVDAMILCDGVTDLFNPNTVRNSMGALFSVPVAEASVQETMAWLREHRIQTLAASPKGDALYTEADLRPGTALIVGAEKDGLTEAWMQGADRLIRIPMQGQVDSLNVASSATLLLYEAVRQRALTSDL